MLRPPLCEWGGCALLIVFLRSAYPIRCAKYARVHCRPNLTTRSLSVLCPRTRVTITSSQVMYENARYAFTETCLALTVFRGDLTAMTIALFIQLLLVKAFHWLSRVRAACAMTRSAAAVRRTVSCVFVLSRSAAGSVRARTLWFRFLRPRDVSCAREVPRRFVLRRRVVHRRRYYSWTTACEPPR